MTEIWKPKEGETYWNVNAGADIAKKTWGGLNCDEILYQVGNCFRTEEAATAADNEIKKKYLGNQIKPMIFQI